MRLVLERCTIRPWRLDDAESLVGHANNRKVWLGVRDAFPHPYTIRDAHEFIGHATSEYPVTRFCIDIDGVAVGGIGILLSQDVHRHTATMGYWLAGPTGHVHGFGVSHPGRLWHYRAMLKRRLRSTRSSRTELWAMTPAWRAGSSP